MRLIVCVVSSGRKNETSWRAYRRKWTRWRSWKRQLKTSAGSSKPTCIGRTRRRCCRSRQFRSFWRRSRTWRRWSTPLLALVKVNPSRPTWLIIPTSTHNPKKTSKRWHLAILTLKKSWSTSRAARLFPKKIFLAKHTDLINHSIQKTAGGVTPRASFLESSSHSSAAYRWCQIRSHNTTIPPMRRWARPRSSRTWHCISFCRRQARRSPTTSFAIASRPLDIKLRRSWLTASRRWS